MIRLSMQEHCEFCWMTVTNCCWYSEENL